ncbi:hypothetical protein J8TS2_41860 [Lederbergia ruris]|uniref:Type I restriction modification DNA specificity domain-containing protein n=1 Tax=Lederbergia ruris TaxID=217495 RepID=A0ABQ4KR97_9BACI|nr:restriction endonuclease subunit S [Lederbergia ruris]GIN59867.1 hypothetical protein J8TS2_41860 [Lederbergia ruris]
MKKLKIKDLFKIRKGKKVKPVEEQTSKTVRYIQIEDLRDDSNMKFCKVSDNYVFANKNNIIIAWDGANAGTISYGLEGFIGSTLAVLETEDKEIFIPYIGKYLQSKYNYLRDTCTGATIPHISRKALENLEVPIPSFDKQRMISDTLDKARSLIDKRKAQIEALDQLTQSVFLELFGDPYINPNSWPIGTIGDLTEKTQYGTSKKASENTGQFPVLRMGNITYNGSWNFNDMKYVDLDDKELEKYLVRKGELLFNRTNSKELVGKTAVFREEEPVAFAGYLVKLITNEKANSEFISGYLNSKYGKALLFSMAKNIVGMANINAKELMGIKIYIPPKDLQDKYANIVLKILEKKELLLKGLYALEENNNSLLQRAFKGELFDDEKV